MYQTGEVLKRYLNNQRVRLIEATQRTTGPIQRMPIATLETVETQRLPYNKELTKLMPIASQYPIATPRKPPFLEYRRDDNPLLMLYGAVLFARSIRQSTPHALFLPETLIPALARETLTMTDRLYDNHYYVYNPKAPGKVQMIPVFTECLLPLPILEAIGGMIRRDAVICLFDD